MEQLLPAEAAAPPGDDGQGAAPRTQPVMMLEPFDEVAVEQQDEGGGGGLANRILLITATISFGAFAVVRPRAP